MKLRHGNFWRNYRKRPFNGKPLGMRALGQGLTTKGGEIHAVADTTYIGTRIAALENMLKGLVMPQQPTNYPTPQLVAYSHCQSLDHSLSTCPMFSQHLATGQEQGQVNVAFQRPKFDPYSSTYNLGWAKNSNFSWSGSNAQSGNYQGNSSSLPNQRPPFQGEHTMLLGLFPIDIKCLSHILPLVIMNWTR